ncbi:hypothetical protein [Scytonema sp. HK-05]|nr:hypothetical protein [Scytonema sp. HK-05]
MAALSLSMETQVKFFIKVFGLIIQAKQFSGSLCYKKTLAVE